MGWCKLNLHMPNGTDSSGVCNLECGMRCLKALSNTYIKIILARVALVCHVLQKQEKIKQTAKLIFVFFYSVRFLYLHREQLKLYWLWRWKKSIWKFVIFFSHIYIHVHDVYVYIYICLNRDLSFEIIMRPNRISHYVFWIVI